jgi:hypothetical protein
MNENITKMIKLCNNYLAGEIGFKEFDQEYDNALFSCEYSDAVSEILDEIQYDIAMTVRIPLTEEDKKMNYITEEQLREKIANYLKDLAIKA